MAADKVNDNTYSRMLLRGRALKQSGPLSTKLMSEVKQINDLLSAVVEVQRGQPFWCANFT